MELPTKDEITQLAWVRAAEEEAIKNPWIAALLTLLSLIAGMTMWVLAGPSLQWMGKHATWFKNWEKFSISITPDQVSQGLTGVGLLLLGLSGKFALVLAKSLFKRKTELVNFKEGNQISPEPEGASAQILLAKIKEWEKYADHYLEMSKRLAAGLAEELLWRRLLLRCILICFLTACLSFVASRFAPLEVNNLYHTVSVITSMLFSGFIGGVLLNGPKFNGASILQVALYCWIGALAANVSYCIISLGYARHFADLDTTYQFVAWRDFRLSTLLMLFRVILCPLMVAFGAIFSSWCIRKNNE